VSISLALFSLCAGWLVNLAADTLPTRRSIRQTWYWPLYPALHLLSPRPRLAAPYEQEQPRLGRSLAVWIAVFCLGWLAEWRTEGLLAAFILAGQAWFFLAIAVIDLEHRLVLNRMLVWAAPVIVLGNWVLGNWATGTPALSLVLWGALAGFAIFATISFAWPGSIGMGDAKLAGLMGLTLGLNNLWLALLISACAGGLAGLLILIGSRFRRRQTIAYAPYLVLGAWVALFFGASQGRGF
jgi:prepilin signal peptidase PulO-like enzyme (type II secretory pathway)